MSLLRPLGILSGGQIVAALEQAAIRITGGSTPTALLVSLTTQRNITLNLTEGGIASEAGSTGQGQNRLALMVDGVGGSIAAASLTLARNGAATGHSVTGFLERITHISRAVELLSVTEGGKEWLLAARPAGQGLSVFRLDDESTAVATTTLADNEARYLAGISSLASARIGNATYVFSGSQSEHGLSAFRLHAGKLDEVATLGARELLPVAGVSALRTLTLGDTTFLVAAASGSSSLTILRIGTDGTMIPTDQVIDSLETRFQSVRAIEVIEVDGRAFVIAAGADDGLSLFTLTPGGRLVHLDTIADSAETALANVTSLSAARVGNTIQILTVSGAETGVTVVDVALSRLGAVIGGTGSTIAGTARDDVILDGPGSQRLTGGAGADTFVLVADGATNTITDFQPGLDRLDLGAWPMLRSRGQIVFTPTAEGGILTFRNERLEIVTANHRPLTLAQFQAMSLGLEVTHIDLATSMQAYAMEDEPPRFEGGRSNDILIGSDADEIFYGREGSDTIHGGGGDDTILGGADNDWLHGGSGNDSILGNNGFDRIFGEDGNDYIDGGAGNDTIRGGTGNDMILGGTGHDWIYGDEGNDLLQGGPGNDRIWGGDGNDRLFGDEGDDSMDGGAGNDTLRGGDGNDTLLGGGGRDYIYGGLGDDRILGGTGNDWIHGEGGNDYIDGGTGNDTIYGGTGNDSILGQAGNDVIDGGVGNDTIRGGPGHDRILGGSGADSLFGGYGNDTIDGGTGNDFIQGGPGNDWLYGGPGADAFAFETHDRGELDRIMDYESGLDRIHLANVGSGNARARFNALTINDVALDGVTGAMIEHEGHRIFVAGLDAADLHLADFVFY